MLMEKFKVVKQVPIEEIRNILGMPNYEMPIEFFTQNEHLGNNLGFLGLGGSISYGTNLPGKGDVDLRGMFLEKPHELIGTIPNPGQAEDPDSDTVIYSFNKLFGLLLDCNPNTIELIGLDDKHIFFLNELGKKLFDDKQMFLSRLAIPKFAGYANEQFNRLENAIARDRLTEEKKMEHVRGSMERSLANFATHNPLKDYGSVQIYTGKEPDGTPEIYMDVDVRRMPVRQFNGMKNELTNVFRAYNKLNHRNKKDEEHLDKHAMHLVRLYLMGLDILEKQEIRTYRPKEDREILLEIRQGKYRLTDGSYHSSFFDMLDVLKQRFDYASKHTTLPEVPNAEWANEFKFEVNRRVIELA